MGKQNAYGCDAPKCTNLVPTEKGQKGAPDTMFRLTVASPGDEDAAKVAFCGFGCVEDWLEDWGAHNPSPNRIESSSS